MASVSAWVTLDPRGGPPARPVKIIGNAGLDVDDYIKAAKAEYPETVIIPSGGLLLFKTGAEGEEAVRSGRSVASLLAEGYGKDDDSPMVMRIREGVPKAGGTGLWVQ